MTDDVTKILDAFSSSPHRWRTARAIAKETGMSVTEVTRILERSPQIVKARKGNDRGEALFARKEKRSIDTSLDRSIERHDIGEEAVSNRFRFLVLLPFGYSEQHLRNTIASVIRQAEGEPLFLDENIKVGALWVDEISRLIRTSDAVIADLTRMHPNIMFELGMAHGLGKPLVLLLSESANLNVPSDLAGYHYITYAPENLSAFSTRLTRTVRQLVLRRGEL